MPLLTTSRLPAAGARGLGARSRERLRHLPYGATGRSSQDGTLVPLLTPSRLPAPEARGLRVRSRERLRHLPYDATSDVS